jgi:ethanolamine utilization microcompartment shell protein EutL
MFKRLIAFMMVIFIFTTAAQASVRNGLKTAFDELNYNLNVAWDQKDQSFYHVQVKAFTANLQLLQTQGLTNAELINFIKAEVKDAQLADDIEKTLNIISFNKMPPTEASNYMIQAMEKSYSHGASWNGHVVTLLVFGVLMVAAAVLIGSSNNAFHTGHCYGGQPYCG